MISKPELLKCIFSTGTVMCNPLRSFIQAQIQSQNERLAVTTGSCGDVIRKTAAFISKKFSLILYLFFNQLFLLSQEAAGALMGKIRGIWLVMMRRTVAFCLLPSATSHQRWLKRPNDESPRVNPPLLSVSSTQQMFSL